MANIRFLVVDQDGYEVSRMSLPERMFPPEIEEGHKILVADAIPEGSIGRFDMRKLRRIITHASRAEDFLAKSEGVPETILFAAETSRLCDIVDKQFSDQIASVSGPFAALHERKRIQAEAGGGPLIKDDEIPVILARAAEEDAIISSLDRRRLDLKERIRAATSMDELAAIDINTSLK